MNKNFADQFEYALDRVFVSDQPIPPSEFFQQDLTVDGTPSGSDEMAVNGSITPVDFYYTVPAGKMLIFHRLVVQIVDTSIVWDGWGAIAGPLTNGVAISIRDAADNAIIALPALKRNYELVHQFGAGSVSLVPGASTEDNLIVGYDVHEQSGYVFALLPGYKVELIVQDDLTALTHMDALITGRLIDWP